MALIRSMDLSVPRNALPIVFLTGMGDIQMSVNAMMISAVDFLVKPIDNARLFAAVDQTRQRDQEQRVQEQIAG